jgi:hypothetical protein
MFYPLGVPSPWPKPIPSCSVDDILKAICEVLFEFAWKGPGCLILRALRPKRETNPDGCMVLIVGTAFWAVIGLAIWGIVVLVSR